MREKTQVGDRSSTRIAHWLLEAKIVSNIVINARRVTLVPTRSSKKLVPWQCGAVQHRESAPLNLPCKSIYPRRSSYGFVTRLPNSSAIAKESPLRPVSPLPCLCAPVPSPVYAAVSRYVIPANAHPFSNRWNSWTKGTPRRRAYRTRTEKTGLNFYSSNRQRTRTKYDDLLA